MKNPTLETGKQTALHLAMQARDRAAPAEAPRIPNMPAAYCAYVEADGTVFLFISVWTWEGRCVVKRVCPDSKGHFTFKQRDFWLDFESLQVSEQPGQKFDAAQTLRARALLFWTGTNTEVPRELAIGISSAAVKRYRQRRAAKVMTEHLPDGYSLLPGCDKPAAYRVDGDLVEILTPRARPEGENIFRREVRRLYGSILYRGVEYKVADGKLYRPGKPEDLWSTPALSVDDRLLAQENAPRDAKMIDGAWFKILPGLRPKVEFHFFVRGKEQVKTTVIKDGLVTFKNRVYAVRPDGSMEEAL